MQVTQVPLFSEVEILVGRDGGMFGEEYGLGPYMCRQYPCTGKGRREMIRTEKEVGSKRAR